MMEYKSRIADALLQRKLRGKGAVLIQGAKWCGKTTTAEQMAKSAIYMNDPQRKSMYLQLVEINIKRLLDGDTPHLIDEWQLAPQIWDAVRYEVDHRNDLGQFILTGSAVPADKSKIDHSGTGRFSRLTMRPMSLLESGDSTGEVSLEKLFEGANMVDGYTKQELEDIAFLICRGGWPRAVTMDKDVALDQAKDYLDGVAESDISRVDGVQRNPETTRHLLRSYARNQGAQATVGTIKADMNMGDSYGISEKTVSQYINALQQIFVIEDAAAWNPNLRSKTAIRTTNTRYFVDPSIASAALGFGPKDLINDLETMGLMNHIIPVATRYQSMLIDNIHKIAEVFPAAEAKILNGDNINIIKKISSHTSFITENVQKMVDARKIANKVDDQRQKALLYHDTVAPYMESIRYHIDKLELIVEDEMWTLPKYRELLFIR